MVEVIQALAVTAAEAVATLIQAQTILAALLVKAVTAVVILAPRVLEAAVARGWTIGQIWNTHWHGDHIGGNAGIKAATGCTVTGPAAEQDRFRVPRILGEEA